MASTTLEPTYDSLSRPLSASSLSEAGPSRPLSMAAQHTLAGSMHRSSEVTLRSPTLEFEIERDELRLEKYGGDDPQDPPARKPGQLTPPPPPETNAQDPDLVTWDGPDDPANPQNWSAAYKWLVTGVAVLLALNVTFASSAPTAAVLAISEELDIPREVSYLVTTTFLIGYVIGPLLWGPGSELIGRRPVFVATISVYTVLHLGQALANNITTLLITRGIAGIFAVAPLTNSGGLIADIWDPARRGLATSMFTASVFLGPVLGPICSSFIVESSLGWRWVFWVMMIFAGTCALISIALLPETYAPVILRDKARRLRKAAPENNSKYAEMERQDWSVRGVLHRSIFRPFIMLAQEPILVLITIYVSIVYGLLYALFEAFPIIFIERRGFTITQSGLTFIGVGIGTTLGSVINARLSRHYPELIKRWRGFPPPEERLYGAMIAGPALVLGTFWLGWTGQYGAVPWYVPELSTILIGMSISLVFMSFLSYLIDTYLMYSASAFSANTFIRSGVAAVFPLFTVQMFNNMGINWACTLIGLVALVLAPSPFLFYKYGPAIRRRSKFAPCIDLKIADELKAKEEAARREKIAEV